MVREHQKQRRGQHKTSRCGCRLLKTCLETEGTVRQSCLLRCWLISLSLTQNTTKCWFFHWKKRKKWCPVWPSWWVCIKVHASCRQGCCAVGDTTVLFRLLPSLYLMWSRSDSSSSLAEWPSVISLNSRVSAAGWKLICFRKTSWYPLDHESHPSSKLLSWGEQSSLPPLTLDSLLTSCNLFRI